ncbi:ribosome biogenesis GTPase YlqF [Aneurinibacillus thermoaerophilus]|uniref:Ribosome biogenesis GTPase A n=1 Tax=Aneurinibacillus thermoaerophilus TaxID=143495 RepID=A0A1G7WDA9_ANETH|nr:ribosome biogenesis GTPase YlqF [Aneurinibacillus thermoaerophilus]MED0678005.1 ribosome biogenesis GTPase YlqF [Aneurinibacillus thermoaerophilus]MED0736932.1 ribosome biogenesis GTPase YlqF [Aneurinibacillus thermoaerophilus]MED0756773.1 ribosome biogenesis GTPase YlqF [Aneurinibacillus thermoaerophilus]MED0760823.1 ribosome biogenesis GTPase YlqF [Aneurinibacillus thermoaerophilus]MED0763434.1 ribosome biogenesis GTPase YlqF [Aneurinibacillus thermoaerophilus]
MTIQWFPGHMAKARRQVTEKLKLIDVVIELLDARLPLSSRNPMIDEIVSGKPRLILLNKSDLAAEEITKAWVRHFAENGIKAIPIDALSGRGVSKLPQECEVLVEETMQKRRAKGMQDRAIRAMILGIPNVGKSSLMNRLAGRKVAQTGDRPAVTKAQQWVKVGKVLELLDTPGILWPKFEDPLVGLRLAASGAIKDEIIDFQEVALFVVAYLRMYYSNALKERYQLAELPESKLEILTEIGRKRGCLVSGGHIDYDKVAELILRELRGGKIGRISLERPDDEFTLEMARVSMDELTPY